MAEDTAGNCTVIGSPWLAENVRRGDPSVVLADVCQRPYTGGIADGPDAVAGAHTPVDVDSGPIEFDAKVLEPKTLESRAPPGRDKESLAGQCGAVLKCHDVAVTLARDARGA